MKLWFSPKKTSESKTKMSNMDTKPDNSKDEIKIDKDDSLQADLVKAKSVEPRFKVISINKTEAPSGMTGDNWYRYIIGQGTSKIEGLTMGDLKKVTQHAEAIAVDLNDRSKSGVSSHKTNKSKATPPRPPAPAVDS